MKLISSKPLLLKCRVVQDVCRTPIVHQHPFGCIVSNKQSDDDGVIIGVVKPFSILVRECDSLFVRCSRPWWLSRELYVLHYLQVRLSRLGRLPCWGSPMVTLISPSGGRDNSSTFPFNFLSLWSCPRKFLNFPYLMRFSICCFKLKHSSVSCP